MLGLSGFELLEPRGLLALLGIPPLVLLYVLKIRRQRVVVGSTWLWASARRDLLAKSPFKRLMPEVALLLQVIALALLAVALARPARRGTRIDGDHVALVIDTSASMGAQGRGGSTRLGDAKRAAAAVIDTLSPGAEAMVVEAGRTATAATPLERDRRQLEAAIDSLAVREVEGDLGEAVSLAADRLRTLGGSKKIVVFTDLALARPVSLVASGLDVDVVRVGEPVENAAVVRLDVRAGADPATRHEEVQVFALLANSGRSARDAYVTVTLEGAARPLTSRRVLIPAEGKLPVTLSFEPGPPDFGRGFALQIAPGDALPIDDVAFGRVPNRTRMPVTLVSAEARSWVLRALEAAPDVDLQVLTPEEAKVANIDPDAFVVYSGLCPPASPGADVLVLGPPRGTCFGIDVDSAIDHPTITSWETGESRLRFLTLDGVHIRRAWTLGASGSAASLVRAGGAKGAPRTIVADASLPGRTVTLVGFDVGDSDWPLKASFVLFVRNAVELARTHRTQGGSTPGHTGEPLRVPVPTDVTEVKLEDSTGGTRSISIQEGFALVPAVDRTGLYRVKWDAPHLGEVLLPVNLTSEAESNLARVVGLGVELDQDGAHRAAALPAPIVRGPSESHHEWGRWLALAATLFAGFDLYWLTRTRRSAYPSATPRTRARA